MSKVRVQCILAGQLTYTVTVFYFCELISLYSCIFQLFTSAVTVFDFFELISSCSYSFFPEFILFQYFVGGHTSNEVLRQLHTSFCSHPCSLLLSHCYTLSFAATCPGFGVDVTESSFFLRLDVLASGNLSFLTILPALIFLRGFVSLLHVIDFLFVLGASTCKAAASCFFFFGA